MKYKVIFQIGSTKLCVKRIATSDINAYTDAKIEAQEIAKNNHVFPINVEVVSVSRI